MSPSKISINIRKARKQQGLSLEKVSKLADLSLNTVIKIENGENTNPTIDTLSKISKALNLNVNDIIN